MIRESIKVGCKVNLSLKITGVREDGYHLLDSIFWPLSVPCDTLEFTPNDSAKLTVTCHAKGINCEQNTLTKAYDNFCAAGGEPRGAHVHLTKGIPHGAGLGGGSSDAAAVLRWCNKNCPAPLTEQDLHSVALGVGADVPYFLYNKPARVKGVGDIIEPCEHYLQGKALLLACPQVYVSTPWAYKAWDQAQNKKILRQRLTIDEHKAKDCVSCATWFTNDFEDVVFGKHPELRLIKEKLLQNKASAVVMSGSGASITAIFDSLELAKIAADAMRQPTCTFFASML